MDRELYKATVEGNTEALLNLIEQDELILHRITTITPYLETPLHVAAMRGHERFVSELLKLKPQLATELDYRRSSPLHLAASCQGCEGVVRDLLRVNPDMCLAQDRDGRNPLHIAAMRGRIGALREMLQMKPEAARALVNESQSILHLCVEYSQFEALKLLVETLDFQDLVNYKDKYGNSVLHQAVADKQVKMVEILLSIAGIGVNTSNQNGMTAMDILIQRRMDTRDVEMEESLKRAGDFGARENGESPAPIFLRSQRKSNQAMFEHPNQFNDFQRKIYEKLIKSKDDWLDKKTSAMMVVATLIAGMAFQIGTNPPNGVWNTTTCTNTSDSERQGSIKYYLTIMYEYLKKGRYFYMVNTTGFIASLSIIFLLMSGLPLKNRVFVPVLMFISWIAITAIALSYTVSLIILSSPFEENWVMTIIGIVMLVWICLMGILVFGHTIRLLFKTLKLLFKACTVKRKRPIYQDLRV